MSPPADWVTVRGVDRPPLLAKSVAGAFVLAEKMRLYDAALHAAAINDEDPDLGRVRHVSLPDFGFVQFFCRDVPLVTFPASDLPPYPPYRFWMPSTTLPGERELLVDPEHEWKDASFDRRPLEITRWEWTGPPGITKGLAFRDESGRVELWEAR